MNQVIFNSKQGDDFYRTLRQRVNEYFKSNQISKFGDSNMVIKTIFMLALYLVPFILILTIIDSTPWNIFMWVLMGFGMSGLGLSVMHDANHGSYSKKEGTNKFVSKVLVLLGGHDVNWRIQHNVLHHTYTNVTHMDEDIDAPSAILRFSPHEKLRKIHRFQFIYAWPFYGLMTLMWFVSKDYVQAARYTRMNLIKTQKIGMVRYWVELLGAKLIYAFLFLALPMWISPCAWYVNLIGFLIMQFIGGLVLALIFQPAHVVPSSDFPMPDEKGNLENNWAIHQLLTTANFAPKARLFSWFVGGLNFQIEHHLFPNICHVHYRNISKIVKETASEFQLPYHSNKTFLGAIVAHGKMLYSLGRV